MRARLSSKYVFPEIEKSQQEKNHPVKKNLHGYTNAREGGVAEYGMVAKDKSNKTITFYRVHTGTERASKKSFNLFGVTC